MNTFHIVALGPPNAGKTVYLSVLHHVLCRQAIGDGVLASVRPEQASWLTALYDTAIDPHSAFPQPTQVGEDMRQIDFTFAVTWTQRRMFGSPLLRHHPVLKISYVDYAGEWLPDAHSADKRVFDPFSQRLDEAHALVGIIDGLKLLRYLDGDLSAKEFFGGQLQPIVGRMVGTDKPVHFVITKWDLFDGRYTFEEVRAQLLDSREAGFRTLVESRTARRSGRSPVGTVRLIPVSSLGDLVTLTPQGKVAKDETAQATHVNIEIPLAAALVDVCELAAQQLRRAERERVPDKVERASPPAAEIAVGGVKVNLTQIVMHVVELGEDALTALGRPAAKVGRSLRRQFRRVRSMGLYGVKSDEAALYYLTRVLRERLKAFESAEQYGGSLLALAPDRRR